MNQYGTYTQETFIERASKIHNYIYDYSRVCYKNSNEKVCIVCKKHGEFWQRPADHVRGIGCPKCGQERSIAPSNQAAANNFIKKCKEKHGDKYLYDKVCYVSSKQKVVVTCKKHGDFLIRPNNILNGQGCPKCYDERRDIVRKKNTKWFIEKAIEKHGERYDYSLVDYSNCRHKVKIVCKKHGIFEVLPSIHLYGVGCPHCKESHGESYIRKFLEDNKIDFIPQYKINSKSLPNVRRDFRVDFYLPKRNMIIEFNGEQHYQPINIFGGEEVYVKQVERDNALRKYCYDYDIELIEISFKDINVVEKILAQKLNIA